MGNIYKKAYYDYLKLVEIVKGFDGNLESLCERLEGFNLDLDEERFDCNYGALTATIYAVDDELFVYRYVDVWDDENFTLLNECVDYVDLIDK